MANISLRSYIREIENLIERGQTAEAIGHCKHILQKYPKHLDTYRLLGKAFLESQRYTEAADVLERVLTAIPDDYIAHLGMSIIREDEGNLDAAIWHMERVFEVQPSNPAFQSELRRLYGRRDGIEPPKIRLTRGALVRMYAKGDLLPQATAEIRSALAEDPNRIDLESILASVYYDAGRKVEATETCSRIVSKTPFNFEANRILSEILPSTSRAEDARIYQSRLQAMDPYTAFLSSDYPASADVPDDAVLIEKIDWQPTQAAESQPAWAQSIGLAWEDTPQPAEPGWMSEARLASDQVPAVESSQSAAAQLPDFLTGAGWTSSSEDLTSSPETQTSLGDEPVSGLATSDELAEAEIPDWLAAMAPPVVEETPAEDDTRAEWLSNILGGTEQPSSAQEAAPQAESVEPAEDADWLAGLGSSAVPESGLPAVDGKDVPDWLSALGDESTLESTEVPGESTPPWLSELRTTNEEGAQTSSSAESIPDWMNAIQPAGAIEEQEPAPTEEASPDWLASLTTETPTVP